MKTYTQEEVRDLVTQAVTQITPRMGGSAYLDPKSFLKNWFEKNDLVDDPYKKKTNLSQELTEDSSTVHENFSDICNF